VFVVVLYCFLMCVRACVCVCVGFCSVCVCVGFVMSRCFGNTYVYCTLTEVFPNRTEVFLILTEVFPCFFLSCKTNARVKLTKTPSSTLVVICVVLLLFVLFYVLFVCKCVLPRGDNPIAVNKYVISYYKRTELPLPRPNYSCPLNNNTFASYLIII
jgi:hypothetical protein